LATRTFPRAIGNGAPVVSSDLDGTMINNDGSLHGEPLRPVLEAFTAATHGKFVLNSDTSLRGLEIHQRRMNLDGLIAGYACENGAYFQTHYRVQDFPIKNKKWKKPTGLHHALVSAVTERFRTKGWDIMLTHPATMLPYIQNQRRNTAQWIILIDQTRLVSFTATALNVIGGVLVTNEQINAEAAEIIREEWVKLSGQNTGSRVESGDWWIDLPAEGVSKANPLKHLQKTRRPVYHIGDGSNDVSASDAKGVVVIAVGANCSLARKGRPDFITKAEGPAGWIEAMRLITEAHKS